MQSSSLELPDEAATLALGALFANRFGQKSCLILLSGPLGAGKTTFVRGFITALAQAPLRVTSPTYSYVNAYETNPLTYHFDLYRIESASALSELGLIDTLYDKDAVRLVEWPERLRELTVSADIHLQFTCSGSKRIANILFSRINEHCLTPPLPNAIRLKSCRGVEQPGSSSGS